MALSVGSGVSGFLGQAAAASETNRVYGQNRANALAAWREKDRETSTRQSQELESAAAQKFDTALEARKGRATHIVAAGESGLSGLSTEAMLRDFGSREARYDDRVDQQTDWTMAQLQSQKRGLGYEAVDRVNRAPRAAGPSFVDLGLKVATAGLNAHTLHKKSER